MIRAMGGLLRAIAIATVLFGASLPASAADVVASGPTNQPLAPASAPDFSGSNLRWMRGADNDCWAYSEYYANSFTWTGSCKDRLIDGKGKLTLLSFGVQKAVLTGVFARGKLNGAGRSTYSDGTVLNGTFVDGKLEGSGKQTYACGQGYEGTFHNGEPDGQGTFHYCSGGGYVGGLRANQFEGAGVWTMSNGAVVEATFAAGQPVGTITHRSADGTVLKGVLVFPHNDPAFPILPTEYPDQEQSLGLEGRVWVDFTVTADGHTKDVRLDRSSGRSNFDNAALAAGPTWRMIPATVGGVAVEWPVRRAVAFKLQD